MADKKKDISIDIETLSLDNNATILSIGAVEFDAESLGREFYFELKPDQDRHIDPSTALWWAQQSTAFDDGLVKYGLEQVLLHLNKFLDDSYQDDFDRTVYTGKFDGRIWANSPVFDLAILRNAFNQHRIDCLWKYHHEMDIRTVKKFVDRRARPEFEGHKHNALDDAKHQARLVQQFLKETGTKL